jgi:hypothetical protein
LSGAIVAERRQYDVTGVAAIALVSSTGGGLLRDGLFLQSGPPALPRTPAYLAIVALAVAGVVVFGRRVRNSGLVRTLVRGALVLGLSLLSASLWRLPWSAGFIAGSMAAPAIARRVRPAFVMGAGLIAAAVGFAVLSGIAETGVAGLLAGSLIFSLALAPAITRGTDLIVGAAPRERAGTAAAISETSSEFGGALGIAVLSSIGTAIYRGDMARAALDGVPAEARRTATDTLGGAAAAAPQLVLPSRLCQPATDPTRFPSFPPMPWANHAKSASRLGILVRRLDLRWPGPSPDDLSRASPTVGASCEGAPLTCKPPIRVADRPVRQIELALRPQRFSGVHQWPVLGVHRGSTT